jgi:outer membrane protein OmpA-like peptidoglycan-associated protein
MSRRTPLFASTIAAAFLTGCASTPPPAPQSVHFDTASAVVRSEAKGELQQVAEYLACDPNAMASIGGHTDSVGGDGYNKQLSQRRAEAVRAALIQQGAPGSRVTIAAHGEATPIADNESAVGRQLNRRSVVVIEARGEPHCGGSVPTHRNSINRIGTDYIARDNLAE